MTNWTFEYEPKENVRKVTVWMIVTDLIRDWLRQRKARARRAGQNIRRRWND